MSGSSTEALELAETALSSRHDSPTEALELAATALQSSTGDDEIAVVAWWAMAMACRELNRLPESEHHLRAAVALAERLGLAGRRVGAESALVNVLTMRGDAPAAIELSNRLLGDTDGIDRAELQMRRALAFLQLGRMSEAIDEYTAALPVVRRGDDRLLEVRLLSNRGNAYAYHGRTTEAIADSVEAMRLADLAGQPFLAGCAAHNAGFAFGRDGDVVEALRAFDRADEWYASVGYPGRCDGVLAADRCDVLLLAGLRDEACDAAAHAVGALEELGDVSDLAEARLQLARALAARGDHAAAIDAATAARRDFETADRPGWSALAEHREILSRAAIAGDDQDRASMLERVDDLAERLRRSGWPAEAVIARLAVAELALADENTADAERHLALASLARRSRRPDTAAAAWLARARLRRLQGNDVGAQRAVEAGLRAVGRHRAALGSTELRAAAAVLGADLAETALELAISRDDPRRILRAVLLARTESVHDPAGERDEDTTDDRRTLRMLRHRLGQAPDDETLRRATELETRLRHRARHTTGSGSVGASAGMFDAVVREVTAADHDTVVFVEVGDSIGAVTAGRGRCQHRSLARREDLQALVESARFSLQRLARTGASASSTEVASATLHDACEQLDALLIAPLMLGAVECAIVPTRSLNGIPWSALPSLRPRATTITPSSPGRRLRRAPVGDARSVHVIVGPGLSAETSEVAAIVGQHPGATVLRGERATVENTLRALETASIAHLACHGRFRADSPMFSSLTLADGPMNVFDLEALEQAPDVVVLPVCDAGATASSSADELLGASAALLALGVGDVIAPIGLVNDRSTAAVMALVHESLGTGASPATALLDARIALSDADPATRAAVDSFLCFG